MATRTAGDRKRLTCRSALPFPHLAVGRAEAMIHQAIDGVRVGLRDVW
jgi:hypothetical protein